MKSKPNCLCHLMHDHIKLKLSRELENSTKNVIPAGHKILSNRQKDMSVWTLSAKILIHEIIDIILWSRAAHAFNKCCLRSFTSWIGDYSISLPLHYIYAPHFIIDRIQIWTVRNFGDHVGGMSGVSLLSILMVYLASWAGTLYCWKIKQPSGAIFR